MKANVKLHGRVVVDHGLAKNLFDVIEIAEAKENPSTCKHTHEEKTFTVWPGTTDERMTWTCVACGQIRGRC
jgi:hypothetical protein